MKTMKLMLLGMLSLSMSWAQETNDVIRLEKKSEIPPIEVSLQNFKTDSTKVKVNSIKEKVDNDGIYYQVDVSGLVVIPVDVGGSIGYSAFDGLIEAEAYAAYRAIRLLASDKSVHIPYGARVRVALNGKRSFYAEYEHEEVLDFGNKYGLLDKSRMFYLTWRPGGREGKTSFSCGYGSSVHNAWSNEDHAPEKGANIRCKVSRKF